MNFGVTDLPAIRARHPEAIAEAAARRARRPLIGTSRSLLHPASGSVEDAVDTAVGLL